jgi:hypothetical protein
LIEPTFPGSGLGRFLLCRRPNLRLSQHGDLPLYEMGRCASQI